MWYFKISWFPIAVNCPDPRLFFLRVKDSHCTYLFMWRQFNTISDCVLEHQLLISSEVCSTHLYLVWLLLLHFRFVDSSEALQLIDSQVTSFLFYFFSLCYMLSGKRSCLAQPDRRFGCYLQEHCKINALRLIYVKEMLCNFYGCYLRKIETVYKVEMTVSNVFRFL